MRTFRDLELVLIDSNGNRYPLLFKDKQLTPSELVSAFSAFLAECTVPEEWAPPSQPGEGDVPPGEEQP